MPREFPCRRCGHEIVVVREVDSPRRLVLNARPVEGGTVVMLGDRAQIVPAGRGLALSLHTCGVERESGR